MKILYFIGNLRSGGRERRLVELLSYLKSNADYSLLLVTAYDDDIAYPKFLNMGISHISLHKKRKHNIIRTFCDFFKICKEYQPDIIHSWGTVYTLYSIPSSLLLKIPIVNSQITDAPSSFKGEYHLTKLISPINFRFSTVICANSKAGLVAYKQQDNPKSIVIYNGVDLNRFVNLDNVISVKERYHLRTKYTVIMVASYSSLKDWDRFLAIAKFVTNRRQDVSFIGVGDIVDEQLYSRLITSSSADPLISFKEKISEVENLVNACDIGVLFSKNGEGISNSILEYMALGKPIIVDNCGGTPEFVVDRHNGFFTNGLSVDEISCLIFNILDDSSMYHFISENEIQTIKSRFTLSTMGGQYDKLYHRLIQI